MRKKNAAVPGKISSAKARDISDRYPSPDRSPITIDWQDKFPGKAGHRTWLLPRFSLLIATPLLLTTFLAAQALEFRDDLGHQIRLASCPQRIISLAPNLTEILFALGLNQEIIGVTRYCDYPEEAKNREVVGGLVDLNLEKIRSLKPDLVLGFRGNPRRVIDRLWEQEIPVCVFDSGRTFDDLFTLITRIGQLTCRQESSTSLITTLKQQITAIEKALPPPGQKKRVFLTMYGQGSGLWTCGRDSYLSYLLQRAQAENLASGQKGNWLVYNREKLIKDDPELILILCRSREDFDRARAWFSAQPALQKISAVRGGHFYFLDEDPFSRFAPRLVEAYRQLVMTLYPGPKVGKQ
ncbi:MAG: ABC transporter substrate-binding protein [Candidatus Aminicenantes bacterium]|uniref:Vitamin B12 ABC transporter, B12-binding component BtuF n=1 Tax=Candidatus Saccharicenans subterraneus TaxID=2508984 RepID=A0A3E2BNA3_9BACT|nr:ABC transporter substrate-binding protein [Candidatus Aminicenantes bacterium]RFT16240.1 MAG: Vitamin B12 ABC transporter, B12-binding component BtuF [Candidatus Saccharicenans subterraneum]